MRVYFFDFTFLVDYFVRPLLSALGVYLLLRRLDRFLAKSKLHVWSCRSVLWLFLTSTLMDDSITEALNQFSWAATGSGSAGGGWSPVHWIIFAIGSCVSLLLQVGIANLKLMSLSWKRLAAFATLLAGAIVIAVVVICVHTLLYVICFSDYFAETVFGVFPSLSFETCSPFKETVEWWALACISMLCIVGPVQSFGMWRAAFKAVHEFDWEELRWEIHPSQLACWRISLRFFPYPSLSVDLDFGFELSDLELVDFGWTGRTGKVGGRRWICSRNLD